MSNSSGSRKQVVFLFIMAIIIALAIVGALVKDRKPGGKIIAKGDRAPAFSLPSLDGKQVSLSDHRGKVVMVHFWATWCPPCVDEIPLLEQLYRTFYGKDFVLLAISVDEGGAVVVGDFMKKNKLSMPVLLNADRSIAGLYGTIKFPETYILDREGIVRVKAIGPQNWMDPVSIQNIQAMLEKK